MEENEIFDVKKRLLNLLEATKKIKNIVKYADEQYEKTDMSTYLWVVQWLESYSNDEKLKEIGLKINDLDEKNPNTNIFYGEIHDPMIHIEIGFARQICKFMAGLKNRLNRWNLDNNIKSYLEQVRNQITDVLNVINIELFSYQKEGEIFDKSIDKSEVHTPAEWDGVEEIVVKTVFEGVRYIDTKELIIPPIVWLETLSKYKGTDKPKSL